MNPNIQRPSLSEAVEAWKKILAEGKFSTDLLWVFEENLCFEKAAAAQGGFHPGFQVQFTPPPEDALDIAYEHFLDAETRIVLYRLGENRGRSVCVLLGDPWFENKGESEGYRRRDEWGVSFFTGRSGQIEEITDFRRWLHRIKRERPLHEVDFCMTLVSVEEIRVHGRVLVPYERFTEAIVGRLRRMFTRAA